MKIYYKKFTLLIFICFSSILVSCSERNINYENENLKNTTYITTEYIQETTETTEATTQEITEYTKDNTNSEILIEKCRDFLYKQEINDEIKYYKIDDIDLDGNNEILIVLDLDDYIEITKVIVLREINGTIKLINDDLGNSGYVPCDADIIQMKDIDEKYIFVKITNGGNLFGFSLYSLDGEEINQICSGSSASTTGTGNDQLMDFDGDGKCDGFVQNRWSYDTLYYDVELYYIWNGKEFIYEKMNIDIGEYPNDIESVILEYMSLYYLYDGECKEIYERLNELSEVDIFNDEYVKASELYLPVYYTRIGINEEIEFSINEQNESAYVNIIWKDEEENIYKYSLNLKKVNDKWKIISSTHEDN